MSFGGLLPFLPVIITLTCAFATRRIILAIFLGVVSAALIITKFSLIGSTQLIFSRFLEETGLINITAWDSFMGSGRLFIFMFLIFLGAIIAMIEATGGAYAYANFFRGKLKDGRQAELVAMTMSTTLFADDYLNALTTGSVMTSITDIFKIPRVKLSVYINTFASTLAALAPVSSWGAAITGFLSTGISRTDVGKTALIGDPYFSYLSMLPFSFFAILIIFSTWFSSLNKISFGLIRSHERIANETGSLVGGKRKVKQFINYNVANGNSGLIDFAIPIVTLVFFVIATMLWFGDFWMFGGSNTFVFAIRGGGEMSSQALFVGGVISLLITSLWSFVRKTIPAGKIPHIILSGLKINLSTLLMLSLAWTLASFISDDLNTGAFFADLVSKGTTIEFLPVTLMIMSAALCFTLGTSWGAMMVMFPLVIPMVPAMAGMDMPVSVSEIPILFPCMAAVLSGALLGGMISPVADLTIMTAGCTGTYHTDYVKAQMVNVIPSTIGALAAFLAVGQMIHMGHWRAWIASLLLGVMVTGILLLVANKISKIYQGKILGE